MFNQIYTKIIITQNLNNIPQYLMEYLIYRLSKYNTFKNFLIYGIDQNNQKQMIQSMLDAYQNDLIGTIKSALMWKTLVLKQQQQILLNYQIQRQYYDTITIRFNFYLVKQQKLRYQIFKVQGQSKKIFNTMYRKNQNVYKMYNTINKYGLKLK